MIGYRKLEISPFTHLLESSKSSHHGDSLESFHIGALQRLLTHFSRKHDIVSGLMALSEVGMPPVQATPKLHFRHNRPWKVIKLEALFFQAEDRA